MKTILTTEGVLPSIPAGKSVLKVQGYTRFELWNRFSREEDISLASKATLALTIPPREKVVFWLPKGEYNIVASNVLLILEEYIPDNLMGHEAVVQLNNQVVHDATLLGATLVPKASNDYLFTSLIFGFTGPFKLQIANGMWSGMTGSVIPLATTAILLPTGSRAVIQSVSYLQAKREAEVANIDKEIIWL